MARDRISPLFEVESPNSKSAFAIQSRAAWLLFFGPINPAHADGIISRLNGNSERAWLTFGLFNFVVYTTASPQVERCLKWAAKHNIRWEKWVLKGSALTRIERSRVDSPRPAEFLQSLARLRFKTPIPELRDAADEYTALLAAAACRCAETGQQVILEELRQANEIITDAALEQSSQLGNGSGLLAIATLVDANASLSRFTSQMFSGISPIPETECHFWTHSLLGTGVANMALVKIRRFITRTLGEARIADQVRQLALIQDQALIKETLGDGPIWSGPWLHHLPKLVGRPALLPKLDPLCPLITYLSGRDGFHTTQSSLSAPLNILTSCSSLRWSLMTITHEMSHRVVDEVLGQLLPDISKQSELDAAVHLVRETSPPKNLLDCLRFKLLDSLLRLNATEPTIAEPEGAVTCAYLADLISARREEVEEIMVHVFDFLYFYGADPKTYVPAIWRSWDAIPRLHRRLPGYVLRTLCAVFSAYWSSSVATQDSISAVRAGMEAVEKSDKENAYIRDALQYLRSEKVSLQNQLWLRKTIVGVVRTFLQSPAILQSVLGQSTKRDVAGALDFDATPIENPLRFIEAHTSNKLNPTSSFWMLCRLAFDSADPDPLRIAGVHS